MGADPLATILSTKSPEVMVASALHLKSHLHRLCKLCRPCTINRVCTEITKSAPKLQAVAMHKKQPKVCSKTARSTDDGAPAWWYVSHASCGADFLGTLWYGAASPFTGRDHIWLSSSHLGPRWFLQHTKFGSELRSKSDTGQINEVLCKVLAHNICVLKQAMHALHIHPIFRDVQMSAGRGKP
jgi:hypothetical protein